jgi:peptidyl-prolyl cis-trans isomerase SurA
LNIVSPFDSPLLGKSLNQTLKRVGKSVFMGLTLVLICDGCNHDSARDVMAKVNAYKVMRSELDRAYQSQIAGAPQKLSLDQERAVRLQLLQQIINSQLYLQMAAKLGVLATDEEVEGRVRQDEAPYTREEFAKKLQDMGYTEDEYRREIRRKLIVDKLVNKEVDSKVTISDTDISDFYSLNKAQFNLAEPQYLLAHIYVNALPGTTQSQTQAYKKIRMVHDRLDAGEDFADLAQRYSEDLETGPNGGELQPLAESSLKESDAPNREAILRLKPNQYSNILKVVNPATQRLLGYRIVMLLGKNPAGQRDLSDPQVQQFIRAQLGKEREQLLRNAYDEVVRDGAEIHNYYADEILKDAGQK